MEYLSHPYAGPIAVAVGTVTTATAIGATYYLSTREPSNPHAADLENQSIEISEGVRGSIYCPDKRFVSQKYDDVTTLYEAFLRGLKVSNNGDFLGTRTGPNLEYEWMSYQEVLDQAIAVGSWLSSEIGLPTGQDSMVAIYGVNSPEWVITELSCYAFSRLPIALYDTLGEDSTRFILKQTSLSVVVCDTGEKVKNVVKYKSQLPNLKCCIIMGTVGDLDLKATESKYQMKIFTFKEVVEKGRGLKKDAVPPKPNNLATIMYTSGTTGEPKGVMMTHANCIAVSSASFLVNEKTNVTFSSEDVHISYLPLAHVFERIVQLAIYTHGGRIGFSRGDIRLLMEDLQALKPTMFPTVPRLLNKIYDKVQSGLQESKIKSVLFRWAMSGKEKQMKIGNYKKDTLWDKLVFQKLRNMFGGRVRLVVTGSAPLEGKVLTFARCVFSCHVLEGYGQTESTAALSTTLAGEFMPGHVGAPLPCNHVKLVDVPEYGYLASEGQGEVCCRGLNVFQGYYKNEEKNREALDDDGWLHTGDIGQWLPNGALKIIDRKKNIFKLSQGEYVAPEKVEVVFMRSKFVAQVFVEGDSMQPYLMCVVVPDEEVLLPWAKNNAIAGDFSALCNNEVVKEAIVEDMNSTGRANGLKGFELARDIVLYPELFSVENGLLTPTFKNKRPELRKRFREDIRKLYAKNMFQRQMSMK